MYVVDIFFPTRHGAFRCQFVGCVCDANAAICASASGNANFISFNATSVKFSTDSVDGVSQKCSIASAQARHFMLLSSAVERSPQSCLKV